MTADRLVCRESALQTVVKASLVNEQARTCTVVVSSLPSTLHSVLVLSECVS